MEPYNPIIIDNGSGRIKTGYGGNTHPRNVFPTIISKPKYPNVIIGTNSYDSLVGDQAYSKRGALILKYPVEHGIVTDWEAMERIWWMIFFGYMSIHPDQHPILITESPLNPKSNREKMAQIFFEVFETQSWYVANKGVLSLYERGVTTGVSVHCGDGVLSVLPIYEGYSFPHSSLRVNMGGRDLTEYMMKIMKERGNVFTTTGEREIVKEIKEKFGFVSLDFERENCNYIELEKKYKLPDEQEIIIRDEIFRCTEPLFQPHLLGMSSHGIHETIYNSIMKCDHDVRKSMYRNIILSGGSTLFPGIDERIKKELRILSPPTIDILINTPHNRKDREISVWRGGSILSTHSSFNQMWVTKEEYEENGSRIIHQKCY